MSGDKSVSLVNVGELAKPADTLIEKVSSAVGGLFRPVQLTRIAKAEAKVALIQAKSEIELTDLKQRAMNRFVNEEAQRQENMESITNKAIPNLDDQSDPDQMDNDWVTNFFDKSRIVSDEEMQDLWAKVLAREANKPGSYSKRTISFLSNMDKKDAIHFQNLCSFVWDLDGLQPLIFDLFTPIYNEHGINFSTLSHLADIGLIKFEHISGFSKTGFPERAVVAHYGDRPLVLAGNLQKDDKLPIGHVLLTQLGKELVSVTHSPSIEGLYEYVKKKWSSHTQL